MFQRLVFHVQDLEQELEVLVLSYFEYVPSDQLLDQGFPQFRSNLEGIHSEAEEDLNNALNVFVLEVLLQLLLVLLYHWLTDQLRPFHPPLVDDYLMMLPKLYFVVLYGIV